MRRRAHALLAIATTVAVGGVARRVVAGPRTHAAGACGAVDATYVDGVVVDREGRAVARTLVVPRPAGAAARAPGADPLGGAVMTDAAGHFRFVGLPPGEYCFVALRGARSGATPAMPVEDRLVVTIRLDGEGTLA